MKLRLCLYTLSLTATLSPLSSNHGTATLKSILSDSCAYQKSPELVQNKKVLSGEDTKSGLGMPGSARTSLSQQISWKEMGSCHSGRACIILPREHESDFESFIRFLLDRDTHFQ